MNHFESSQEALVHITKKLLSNEAYLSKPRGMLTREVVGQTVSISNPRNRLIFRNNEKYPWSIRFAMAEFLWYVRGENSLGTMEYYAPSMKKYSDDGTTLNSAYGFRIFGKHKYCFLNQWEYAKSTIKQDKETRQAVIHIRTPHDSTFKTKDHPCTLALQFILRKNRLNLVVTMRSNDVTIGSTYDIFCFTMLQELMAYELEVELGDYYHQVGSWHLYEKDFTNAEKFVTNTLNPVEMPKIQHGVKEAVQVEESMRLNGLLETKNLSEYWLQWAYILSQKTESYQLNDCYKLHI